MAKRTVFMVAIAALTLMLLPVTTPAQAQAAAIAYGERTTGEVTDDAFEVAYTFTGKAGDVALARAKRDFDDKETDLLSEVMIKDASGKTLADTSKDFSFGDTIAVVTLPADGDYTIIVTRSEGKEGKTRGKFFVDLTAAEALTVDQDIEGEAVGAEEEAESKSAIYAFESADDFILSYTKNDGDLNPRLALFSVSETGSLRTVGTVTGTSGLIGSSLVGKGGAGKFVAVVGDYGSIALNFRTQSAKFTIGFTAIK